MKTSKRFSLIISCFFSVVLTFAIMKPASAQDAFVVSHKIATFEQSKNKIDSAVRNSVTDYRNLRRSCRSKVENLENALATGNQDMIDLSSADLVTCYNSISSYRNRLIDPWMVVYWALKSPEILLEDGWSQKEVDTAKQWSKKFWDFADKIGKVNSEYPTDDQIIRLLQRSGVQIF